MITFTISKHVLMLWNLDIHNLKEPSCRYNTLYISWDYASDECPEHETAQNTTPTAWGPHNTLWDEHWQYRDHSASMMPSSYPSLLHNVPVTSSGAGRLSLCGNAAGYERRTMVRPSRYDVSCYARGIQTVHFESSNLLERSRNFQTSPIERFHIVLQLENSSLCMILFKDSNSPSYLNPLSQYCWALLVRKGSQ